MKRTLRRLSKRRYMRGLYKVRLAQLQRLSWPTKYGCAITAMYAYTEKLGQQPDEYHPDWLTKKLEQWGRWP